MELPRSYGVLLPIHALPGPQPVGSLGEEAALFGRLLREQGAGFWQVLPLNPLGPGWSPYASPSSFAANPLLINLASLAEEGLLEPEELPPDTAGGEEAKYEQSLALWQQLRGKVFGRAQAHGWRHQELTQFYQAEAHWLEDWAFYAVAKELAQGRPFWQWPEELAMRRPEALQRLAEQHRQAVELVKFEQFLLQWQWERLRRLLSPLQIIGDLPFYVALDSADVWAHPELFLLGPDLKPTAVAGVPPDYFSPDGQLWGNPLYCWERHQETGFAWWRQRIARALQLYDVVRLDHFRGFAATWQVPANAPTARHGQWVPTPGRELFHALGPRRPFLAEDLGHITPDVVALREELGLPGMAILQFAFNPNERSAFLPHRHRPNLVVYTGTHDNNTTLGWWEEEASPEVREFFRAYVGSDQAVHRAMVRLAMASVANLAIVPAQDVLGLPSSYRCNRPGTASGNWRFRLLGSHFYSPDWDWVGELARVYERWRFAETASGPR